MDADNKEGGVSEHSEVVGGAARTSLEDLKRGTEVEDSGGRQVVQKARKEEKELILVRVSVNVERGIMLSNRVLAWNRAADWV